MNEHLANHETWDSVPRDGPLVMVTARLGESQDPRQWIDPTQPVDHLRSDVRDAVGDQAFFLGDWAVTDQIGLGSTMIPEDLSVEGLRAEAQRRLRPIACDAPDGGQPSLVEDRADVEDALWRTPSDLARSFLNASGIPSALEVLPAQADAYVTVDLDRVGRDLAAQLGGTVEEDGRVYIPGSAE